MGCRKLSYYNSETALSRNRKIFVDGLEKSASDQKICKDYYAFGSLMPGRNANTESYRFGFQGQEKDVIFLSCVRTKHGRRPGEGGGSGIGFVRDRRRLNVALTRAKHSLVIVGDSEWLSAHDKMWESLLADLGERRQVWSIVNAVQQAERGPAEGPLWSTHRVWTSLGALLKDSVVGAERVA